MPAPAQTTPSLDLSPARGAGSLWLRRPTVRVWPGGRAAAPSSPEARFMADFLGHFGAEPDWERYARGGGHSFVEMSRELLDGLDRPLPELDTALLAYHLPDHTVIEVAGCYLAQRCAGHPAVFSVAGQGVGAPFTALHILDCLRQAGDLGHGAVFVLDHANAPYPGTGPPDGSTAGGPDPASPDPASPVPGGPIPDCAVLLCTEVAGGDGAAGLDFTDERRTGDPAGVLAEVTRDLPAARIVAGRTLAGRLGPDFLTGHDVAVGPPDQLCTGAWAALAGAWPDERYTVVADYDPRSARLFQAGLRPGASP